MSKQKAETMMSKPLVKNLGNNPMGSVLISFSECIFMSIVRGYPYAQKDFRPFVFILLTDGYDVLLYGWRLKNLF